MGSRLTEFSGSGTMAGPQKRGLLIALLLAALPVIAVAAIIITGDRNEVVEVESSVSSIDLADRKFFNQPFGSGISRAWAGNLAINPADRKFLDAPAGSGSALGSQSLTASELSILRWRAMGLFYEKNGLLTRDSEAMIAPSGLAEALSAERYNRLGEDSQTNSPPVIKQEAAPVEPEYAYYTERYWKMAAESKPVKSPVIATGADLAESVNALDEAWAGGEPVSASSGQAQQDFLHYLNGKAHPE